MSIRPTKGAALSEVSPEYPYPDAMKQYPAVRQSLLSQFDTCALQARMDMEWRSGWSGHPQARGTIFHRTAARCLEIMAREGENNIEPDQALAVLRDQLRQHDIPPEDVLNIPFSQIKDLRWTVVSWAANNQFDITNLVDVERRLNCTVYYDNPRGGMVPRTLTGQLDGLFIEGDSADHALVLDWKDTFALPSGAAKLSAGGYFQQRFYALLVLENFPSVQQVTMREFYVRYSSRPMNDKTGIVKEPVREASVWRDEILDIQEEMSALVERFDRAVQHGYAPWEPEPQALQEEIQAERDPQRKAEMQLDYQRMVGLFSPSPGAHCSYCPRPEKCPIIPEVRGEGAITDAEHAKRVAAEVMVAKSVIKQRDKALKGWADANGPIPIRNAKDPNRVLGFVPKIRESRPTRDELQKAILEAGGSSSVDVNDLYVRSPSARFEQFTQDPDEVDSDNARVDRELTAALEESLRKNKEAA